MTYQSIKDACDQIALHPNEQPTVQTLSTLVQEASKIGYALEFHIGQNLLSEPYIQGYILEKIDDQTLAKNNKKGV